MPWTTPVVLSREQKQRYSRHLLIPEVGAEGQARLLGSQGAVHRRRRPRRAGPAVPRRRRRRHHRHRRLRRRRRLQPPAPGHPHHRPGRPQEDRVGRRDHPGAQPGRERRPPRGDAHRRQRRPAHRGLRRHPRRHRHVRDALHAQRRGRPGPHPGRPRVGVPLRGPADACSSPSRARATAACIRRRRRPSSRPGCSVAGVLGVVPGIMGLLQATEALKLLLGIGEPLVGRLLIYDALDGTFDGAPAAPRPALPGVRRRRCRWRRRSGVVHRSVRGA